VTNDYIHLQNAKAAAEQARDEAREAAVAAELAAFEEGAKKGAAEALTARQDEDGAAQKSDEGRVLRAQVVILQGRLPCVERA
jgi:hypothetical protein